MGLAAPVVIFGLEVVEVAVFTLSLLLVSSFLLSIILLSTRSQFVVLIREVLDLLVFLNYRILQLAQLLLPLVSFNCQRIDLVFVDDLDSSVVVDAVLAQLPYFG